MDFLKRILLTEPARVAELVRVVIALGVGFSWWQVDSVQGDLIISGLGLLISVLVTGWTRGQVVPVEKLIASITAPRENPNGVD